MVTLTWNNLLVLGEGETIEEFLWNSDIASVIFTQDPVRLKNTLLALIAKFEKYAGIQGRCFQLLQDCHLLAPPGIKDEELSPRFDAILRSLSSWIGKVDVILPAFELLSMVADRAIMKKRAVLVENGQLLYLVNKAIAQHHNSLQLQRAALQLYEAILDQTTDQRHLKSIASVVFKPVLDNLLLNASDLSIAFSSLSILITLTNHAFEMISSWNDQLTNMAISLILQHSSPEVASKCIVLIDKLASENDTLFVVVNHERGLMIFSDILATLDASHISAAIISLELLLRILEDYEVSLAAFRNTNGLAPVEYAREFRQDLKDCFERYLGLLTDISVKNEEELQYLFMLHANVEEIIDYMTKPEESLSDTVGCGTSKPEIHSSAELPPSFELPPSPSRRPSRIIFEKTLETSSLPPIPSVNSRRPSYSQVGSIDEISPSCKSPSVNSIVADPNPQSSNSFASNFLLESSIDDAERNIPNGCEDIVEIEAEILPINLKLSKDVPVVVPHAIDCQPIDDDVALPENQLLLSGNPVNGPAAISNSHKELEELQLKLKSAAEGYSLNEMAGRAGRQFSIQRKPRRSLNLSAVTTTKIANNDNKDYIAATGHIKNNDKMFEELRLTLKYVNFQLQESNKRCESFQLLFRNATKSMEALLLENEKLKNKLTTVLPITVPRDIDNSQFHKNDSIKMTEEAQRFSTVNKVTANAKHSLCIGGLIEGLDFIGALKHEPECVEDGNDIVQTKYNDLETSVKISSNPLHYMDEIEVFSAQICQIFNFIIETYYVPDGKSDHTVSNRRNTGLISSRRLRSTLIKMNLVDGKQVDSRYVDFIFAYLNTQLFTVSGVAFVIIYCGKKKFPSLLGIDLVRATQEIVVIYLDYLSRMHQRYLNGSDSTVVSSFPMLTRSEFKDILIMLGNQESTFVSIFRAYASFLKENTYLQKRQPSIGAVMMGHRMQGAFKIANSSAAPSPVAGDGKRVRRLAEDTAEMEYRFLDGRKLEGITFQDIAEFAKDFQICPNLISRLELHECFYYIACDEVITRLKRNPPPAPFSFYLDNKTPTLHSYSHSRFRDSLTEIEDDIHNKEEPSLESDEDEDENDISCIEFQEPSLSSDSRDELLDGLRLEVDENWNLDTKSMKTSGNLDPMDAGRKLDTTMCNPDLLTINFRQFLDFIVMIAGRSPVFKTEESMKAKVNSLLDLMNMSSGKMYVSRRLQGFHPVDTTLEFRTALQYHPSQDDIVIDTSRSHSSSNFASVFSEMAETYGTMDSSHHHFKEYPMLPRQVDSSYYDEDKEIEAEDFYAVTMTTESVDDITTSLSKNIKLSRPISIAIPPKYGASSLIGPISPTADSNPFIDDKSKLDKKLLKDSNFLHLSAASHPNLRSNCQDLQTSQSNGPVAVATMMINPASTSVANSTTNPTGKGFFSSWFGAFGSSTSKVEAAVLCPDIPSALSSPLHSTSSSVDSNEPVISMDLPHDELVVGGVSYDQEEQK